MQTTLMRLRLPQTRANKAPLSSAAVTCRTGIPKARAVAVGDRASIISGFVVALGILDFSGISGLRPEARE